MKLAEALLIRADIVTRLTAVRERIHGSAVVQQGDKPPENAEKLLLEAMGMLSDLQDVVVRVNRTNLRVKLRDGRTMTEAIAERDRLKQQHSLLIGAAKATKRDPDRYGTREIKWVAQLDVAKLQKQADDVSKKVREINTRIQEANWKHEVDE